MGLDMDLDMDRVFERLAVAVPHPEEPWVVGVHALEAAQGRHHFLAITVVYVDSDAEQRGWARTREALDDATPQLGDVKVAYWPMELSEDELDGELPYFAGGRWVFVRPGLHVSDDLQPDAEAPGTIVVRCPTAAAGGRSKQSSGCSSAIWATNRSSA